MASLTAFAQQGGCPPIVDDGFSTGVCNQSVVPTIQAAINLMPPVMNQPANYACEANCAITQVYLGDLSVTRPVTQQPLGACDEFTTQICFLGPLNPLFGQMGQTSQPQRLPHFAATRVRLKYSRTWTFTNTLGPHQVWRFLASGLFDFTPPAIPLTACAVAENNFNASTSQPCPIPPCFVSTNPTLNTTFTTVPFVGFIDFVCGPLAAGGSGFSFVLGFSHDIGCVSHADFPTVNGVAIAQTSAFQRHDNLSYHFVSPTSIANPSGGPPLPFQFLPNPAPAATGLQQKYIGRFPQGARGASNTDVWITYGLIDYFDQTAGDPNPPPVHVVRGATTFTNDTTQIPMLFGVPAAGGFPGRAATAKPLLMDFCDVRQNVMSSPVGAFVPGVAFAQPLGSRLISEQCTLVWQF